MHTYKKLFLRFTIFILLLSFGALTCRAKEFYYPAGGSRETVGYTTDVISIGLPVAALTYTIVKKDWNGLLRGSLEAAGVIGTSYLLKGLVKSERPDHSDNHSFPSLHTATSFLTASFLMRRYGWKFGVPAYALSAYVGWGRIYSKRHNFWDVAAGAALGTVVGLVFTTPYMEKHNVTVQPGLISTPSPEPYAAPRVQPALTATITF